MAIWDNECKAHTVTQMLFTLGFMDSLVYF